MKIALCYGSEGPAIARSLESHLQVEGAPTMRAALERAKSISESGDTVLLSPACASFDEFRSFEQRGVAFTEWVRANAGGEE